MLFKATLYVPAHYHARADMRAAQTSKITDLSIRMNWKKPCNAWQRSVLARMKMDNPGRMEGVVAIIDVLINALLQSFKPSVWLSPLWLPRATTSSLRGLFILPLRSLHYPIV